MDRGHDLRALVQPVELAPGIGILRQDEMDFDRVRECARDGITKRVESPTGPRRDDDRRPMEFQLGEDLYLGFDFVVIREEGFHGIRANRIGGEFSYSM